MSYDLYCYRSEIGVPDLDEACRVTESDAIENPSGQDRLSMQKIADALIACDSSLEMMDFDYEIISRNQSITVDKAREFIDYIEISTPDGVDDYIQFNISRNVVAISFGFGMTEAFIERVFEFVDVICKTSGYFLYDPRDESVTDPLHPVPLDEDESKRWIEAADVDFKKESKPWWKIW
jgi:hypothetical protein